MTTAKLWAGWLAGWDLWIGITRKTELVSPSRRNTFHHRSQTPPNPFLSIPPPYPLRRLCRIKTSSLQTQSQNKQSKTDKR